MKTWTWNPDVSQEVQDLVRAKYAVQPRLSHPLHSPDFDPKLVAAGIEHRTEALGLESVRRAGMHWAVTFATSQELAYLEQVVSMPNRDIAGPVLCCLDSYEEELRHERDNVVAQETDDLYDVVRSVIERGTKTQVLARAFAEGALEVWMAAKSAMPKETIKASDTANLS